MMKNAAVYQQAIPGKTRQESVIRSLRTQAEISQMGIRQYMQDNQFSGQFEHVQYFWLINGFTLEATPKMVMDLAARSDVAYILPEEVFQAPDHAQAAASAWDNLGKINAPLLWSLGYKGQGVVIANMDTGVDNTHADLSAQWRGGTNSWFDPADPPGMHPSPTDLDSGCQSAGHGTGTMGIMVGNIAGVAPGAKWIAVKIFSDSTVPRSPCGATITAITAGFQWLLDPDSDPATNDAPQIIINSWGGPRGICGSDPAVQYIFQPAIQALRAAGILPIFAAGNYGPAGESGIFPGTYPEAYPVGATDSQDHIAPYSSRGPNTCVAPSVTYPNIVAPGTDILLPRLGGGYSLNSGTSFAAPHVAGALALLQSAFPQGLTIEQQEMALQMSAIDLGSPGPDNDFGYGRLDVWRAYQQLNTAELKFASTNQAVMEGAGLINILVTRSGGIAQPVIQVDYRIGSGGSATEGVDFMLTEGTLNFLPDQTSQSIPVTILHDEKRSIDKTLNLVLSNPVGG